MDVVATRVEHRMKGHTCRMAWWLAAEQRAGAARIAAREQAQRVASFDRRSAERSHLALARSIGSTRAVLVRS